MLPDAEDESLEFKGEGTPLLFHSKKEKIAIVDLEFLISMLLSEF